MLVKPFALVIPHFGADAKIQRLFKSLGLGEPLLTTRHSVYQLPLATVYLVNNTIENRGFTAATNEGIHEALKNGAEYVWLLNNDTVVENLDMLLQGFRQEFSDNPKTGVVGCKILSLRDPDFIHHAGTMSVYPAGLHKYGRVSEGEYQYRTKERWVTGASMVISQKCFASVGLLDQNFFNYASDSDFCYRARLAGFDVVYLPLPVLHEVGESQNPSPEQQEVLYKDMMYFKAKWMSGEVFTELDRGRL